MIFTELQIDRKLTSIDLDILAKCAKKNPELLLKRFLLLPKTKIIEIMNFCSLLSIKNTLNPKTEKKSKKPAYVQTLYKELPESIKNVTDVFLSAVKIKNDKKTISGLNSIIDGLKNIGLGESSPELKYTEQIEEISEEKNNVPNESKNYDDIE